MTEKKSKNTFWDVRVTLIAEYYLIQDEFPNTTYILPNTHISLKMKLTFGIRRVYKS